jgi:hypothetical protein
VATPNILAATALTPGTLVQAQLVSGNNDYAETLTNVSGSSVTVDVLVVPASAGTARAIVDDYVLAADATLVIPPDMVAMLGETATIRVTSTSGAAVDALITGVVVQ